jgi:hypothetical protein
MESFVGASEDFPGRNGIEEMMSIGGKGKSSLSQLAISVTCGDRNRKLSIELPRSDLSKPFSPSAWEQIHVESGILT